MVWPVRMPPEHPHSRRALAGVPAASVLIQLTTDVPG